MIGSTDAASVAPAVSARNVERVFRDGTTDNRVLKGVSLDIAKGEFVSIVGRSGSGKSTLLHIIGGLDTQYTGEVTVNGQQLRRLSDRDLSTLRNQNVGFVFQSFHLVPKLSVIDNVRLPVLFGQSTRDGLTLAKSALERVGIEHLKDRAPSQLSGGERQRVAIARAIFHSPLLLLCDEPTGNLDTVTAEQVLSTFQELHTQGFTLVVVTHDQRLAQAATRRLTMTDGVLS
jgi:putative ABC transport system ATP-binding protein